MRGRKRETIKIKDEKRLGRPGLHLESELRALQYLRG